MIDIDDTLEDYIELGDINNPDDIARARTRRDNYVPKKLMKEYGFTEETASRAWFKSKTRYRIEAAKDMVCHDDFDWLLQDDLTFMWPQDAYMELTFEMTGSDAWMDIP